MKKLKYTTRVINEVRMQSLLFSIVFQVHLNSSMVVISSFPISLQSLRLYPQPPVLIRRSLENDVLGKYPITRLSKYTSCQYIYLFGRCHGEVTNRNFDWCKWWTLSCWYLQGWRYIYFCVEPASKSSSMGRCRKVQPWKMAFRWTQSKWDQPKFLVSCLMFCLLCLDVLS